MGHKIRNGLFALAATFGGVAAVGVSTGAASAATHNNAKTTGIPTCIVQKDTNMKDSSGNDIYKYYDFNDGVLLFDGQVNSSGSSADGIGPVSFSQMTTPFAKYELNNARSELSKTCQRFIKTLKS